MISAFDSAFIGICLEGFFYGLYSGIFVLYLQCPLNKSRTAYVVFFVLCLLHVLSTATVVSDLVAAILESRIITLSPQLIDDSAPIIYRLTIIQATVSGLCDFIAQGIIIYRCWIMWDQNVRVLVIPTFLAIAYLVSWLVSHAAITFVQGGILTSIWGAALTVTALTVSMVVNALMTGLIVFKILKVFLQVKAATSSTSVERVLGTTGTRFRHVIFVIIESGMALFAIQLVRVVLSILPSQATTNTLNLITGIHQMFNGIAPTIILVRVSMKMSFDDKESFKEAAGSLGFNNPPSNPNTLQRISSSSMPESSEERSVDSDST